MQIVFRADASLEIGTGHVMRCLTLADALRDCGAACRFVCRDLPGNLIADIGQRGYALHVLPAPTLARQPPATSAHATWLGVPTALDAAQTRAALGAGVDWLVVDHYALAADWEAQQHPACHRLLVIDDLADRPHACQMLLDQTFGRKANDYHQRVTSACKLLCGTRYALLRPEFAAMREYSLQRRATPQLKQLLITLGGVDKDNTTFKVLNALLHCPLPQDCRIIVVMGSTAPWLVEVQRLAASMPWDTVVQVGVDNMAQLMADSDLAIGAAGSTSWERCCLGLPMAIMVLADNQRYAALSLEKVGAARMLQPDGRLPKQLAELIDEASHSETCLRQLSESARAITDGQGVQRVACRLMMESMRE